MYKYKFLLFFFLLIGYRSIRANEFVQIFVGEQINEDTLALPGAAVYWEKNQVGAITNEQGWAELPCIGEYPARLIVAFIGYHTDTITVVDHETPQYVFLLPDNTLGEVEIKAQRDAGFIQYLNPIKTEVITGEEFRKAACCNLSESFQTNATVDVGYSDAVTGAKEITMLGLDGVYVNMLVENLPLFRGLVQTNGLEYIQAPWMESVSVSKGISPVRNGYEGLTGAINVIYKEPFEAEKLFVDLFLNHQGRTELSITSGQKINEKNGNVVFLNGSFNRAKWDKNQDGFLDNPLTSMFSVMDRYNFRSKKTELQVGIKYLFEDRLGGEMAFDKREHKGTTEQYGFGSKTNRMEAFIKNGIFIGDKEFQSLGIQLSSAYHNTLSFYGLQQYEGTQTNVNLNIVYENIIKTTNHKMAAGFSTVYDQIAESIDTFKISRLNVNPGVFAEYTYKYLDKLTLMLGCRVDYQKDFKFIASPRLHVRYAPIENTTIRMNAGRGWRISNPLMENSALLTSAKTFSIDEQVGMEAGWNYGFGIIQDFTIRGKSGYINAEYFRTDFTLQTIADVDRGDNKIHVYNLKGKSFSNSFMFELKFEPVKNLEWKFAYRLEDVQSDMHGVLLPKFMLQRHKGVWTTSYKIADKGWEFNLINILHGKHRLALEEIHNPITHEMDYVQKFSPIYFQMNVQVKKTIKSWEFYFGADNLTNFRQKMPILHSEAPFGTMFDATQVWGPINGAIAYGGIRFKLN